MPKPPLPDSLHEFLARPDPAVMCVSLHCRVASLADDPDLVDIDRLAQRYGRSRYGDRVHEGVSAWLDVDDWHAWGLSAAQGRR